MAHKTHQHNKGSEKSCRKRQLLLFVLTQHFPWNMTMDIISISQNQVSGTHLVNLILEQCFLWFVKRISPHQDELGHFKSEETCSHLFSHQGPSLSGGSHLQEAWHRLRNSKQSRKRGRPTGSEDGSITLASRPCRATTSLAWNHVLAIFCLQPQRSGTKPQTDVHQNHADERYCNVFPDSSGGENQRPSLPCLLLNSSAWCKRDARRIPVEGKDGP